LGVVTHLRFTKFELPPALAGGNKKIMKKLALAKMDYDLAKANEKQIIIFLQL
jgi:hypothetical protein